MSARQHFESESSISLDQKEFTQREFTTKDQSKKTEFMLRDYVKTKEAIDNLTARL